MDFGVPRLKGRVVLVAGGTEGLGEGIVRELLRRGAIVVVPSPSAEDLEGLRDRLQTLPTEDLVTIFGDIGRPEEAERIRDVLLGRLGRLDAIVASLGRWSYCRSMVELSLETWQCVLGDSLSTHCVIVRTFVPLLKGQGYGSYTLIKQTTVEAAGTQNGLNAVVGDAQDMLVRVLLQELTDTPVRINEVVVCLDASVCKEASDPSQSLIAECVGTFAAWLASEEAAPVHGATIRLVDRQSVHP
jgi:NAD(P)-dependent dehydrogenase (short-subunit alcohol dehydrogenase family)